MTIAIGIQVNDGIVLASDSASTIMSIHGITNVYDNTNKIFNLYKGLPIGAITWGLGNIGKASISTLCKDFRKRIADDQDNLFIDSKNYTIKDVADKFKTFICDENYIPNFIKVPPQSQPGIGFYIGGYSSQSGQAEMWELRVEHGQCFGPLEICPPGETIAAWNGEGEPITRLLLGFSNLLPHVLLQEGLGEPQIQSIINRCKIELDANFVVAPMPIQDAIQLAEFLTRTAIGYARYRQGPQTIGGPIEIAAITKYEGFKWVKRKHYFDAALNPKEV